MRRSQRERLESIYEGEASRSLFTRVNRYIESFRKKVREERKKNY